MRAAFKWSLAIVCAVLSTATLGCRSNKNGAPAKVRAPDAAAAEPIHVEPMAGRFSVTSMEGSVDVRTPGGEFRPAVVGELLSEQDEIRTGERSSAVLSAGDGNQLTLRERVLLTLKISRSLSEVVLSRGKIRAATGKQDRVRLEVRAFGTQIRSGDKGGERYNVFADENGVVAVATEAGEVQVIAEGKSVPLRAGEITTVSPGQAPKQPMAIPAELLLSVSWEKSGPTGGVLAGKADPSPGTVVTVAGAAVPVDTSGAFRATLTAEQVKSGVSIEAEDLIGRTRVLKSPQSPNERGVKLSVDPSQLWKSKDPAESGTKDRDDTQ